MAPESHPDMKRKSLPSQALSLSSPTPTPARAPLKPDGDRPTDHENMTEDGLKKT